MSAVKSFGSFFRSSRKAMGLSLREFCRRNGFDPGNVSRLERGLVAPPQARKLLESYAKALKLVRGTEAWDTFFELAASETGRIPDELLGTREAAGKLPKLLRKLRPMGQKPPGGVSALHLEAWADSLDARARLPQLVRRLVRATGRGIRRVKFPAGEQVQRPGWDGVVEASARDEYVPAGTSVWEMGVDKNPQRKADEDIAKRVKDSLGLDRKETTFIFVTPRRWQATDDWCRANEKLGGWKEVRVYDSAALEEWLEQAPAVDTWLAGMLGIRPPGVTDLDEYWANLQALTEPSLTPEVFLASREKQVEELEVWLKGPKQEVGARDEDPEDWREGTTPALAIEARSPAEAIDFVAAYSRDPSRADLFAARTLIVESRDAWRSLAGPSDGGLLLIPSANLEVEPELVAGAVREGHRVILPSAWAQREAVTTIRLPRAYRHDLEKALGSTGLDEERASRFSRESGGSVTVLKRLLGRYPGTTRPEWSMPSEAPALLPMLLAGGWDEGSEADRSAIEKLSGKSYSDASEIAGRWLKAQDPPLSRAGTRWSLVSRDDSWFLLGPTVSPESLRRFGEVAREVLGEDDRSLELPPDRWQASFSKKTPRHSPVLRKGLAETLALLGARPERLPEASGARGLADQVVRHLLDGEGWLRWASLSPQLPLLAEAAPESFLDAVQRDLRRAEPALVELFDEDGDPLFTSYPQTGLLWSLEVLAWDRRLLSQVGLILATLDEIVPKSKLGNTPSRSLAEIFMPWLPQTTAPVEERVAVLRSLMRKQPAAGWRLLVGLLPNQHQVSTPTSRPSWRDWALSWSRGVSPAEYWHQVGACAHILVEQLGADLSRWKALVKHFENLPGPARREFVGRLEQLAETTLDEEDRRALSEALRDKVAWHKRFAAADWALPEEVVADLDRVRTRFEPADPIRKHAWLFGPRWRVQETLAEGEDHDERIEAIRRDALRAIQDERGWEGVLRLAKAVESPEELGAAFASVGSAKDEPRIVPTLLVSADEHIARFARGYAWARFHGGGWAWISGLKPDQWSAKEAGQLFVLLPFERRTWDYVAAIVPELATWYWKNAQPFTKGDDPEDSVYAVRMLLEHKRPAEALHVLRMAMHHQASLEPGLLMDALQGWLEAAAAAQEPSRFHGDSHDIHLLFKELQKGLESGEPMLDVQRLAQLEWAYLGVLDGHPASPVTLHGLLRDQPEFFVQVLGLIFRPKDQADAPEPSEEEQLRARNAYRLLMAWQDVPGRGKDGSVDGDALSAWIRTARTLAREGGLLEIADSRIGQVLASAPEDTDGSWPCLPVRDALEDIGTEEAFNGFAVGIYNKRGMFSKSLREGGEQERTLAEKYRRFAESCQIDWPQTAAALRKVAEGYEHDARRADFEAMLD